VPEAGDDKKRNKPKLTALSLHCIINIKKIINYRALIIGEMENGEE